MFDLSSANAHWKYQVHFYMLFSSDANGDLKNANQDVLQQPNGRWFPLHRGLKFTNSV